MAKARVRDVIGDARIDESGRAAIKWMVVLSSGSMTERQRDEFERWRRAHPDNAEAWARMSGGLQPFDVLARSALPRGTVSRLPEPKTRRDRRAVLGTLAGLIATGGLGAASLQRFVPLDDILNDHYTRTGEHDRFRLADGSEVVLAPRSSLNVALGPEERRLDFLHGRMMLQVSAADPRPFVVALGPAHLSTSAGSFVIDRRDEALSVTGLTDGGTLLLSERRLAVRAGERLRFSQGDVTRSPADVGAEASWTTGLAVIDDEPIESIVELIRPYYAGFIRLNPDVAGRRATGVFDLFDPVAALDTLARSVGLRAVQTAGFLIRIEPSA
jgi:transmembrane sensor